MSNQLHGWGCPTCGTVISECGTGHGTVQLEAPARRDNSAITAVGRRAADEIGCSGIGFRHVWLSKGSTDSSVPTSTWCKHCGLVLLPEPPTSTKPADLTPTLQDARAIPCDEARTHHLWTTSDNGRCRCMNCGLVVRDS